MLFWRKTDETIWKPPFSKRPPPPPLSTNHPEQFFHDPPLCPNFKNNVLILGGRKLCLFRIIWWLQWTYKMPSYTKRSGAWKQVFSQNVLPSNKSRTNVKCRTCIWWAQHVEIFFLIKYLVCKGKPLQFPAILNASILILPYLILYNLC